jgi:predicted dehydrogenase
VSPARTWRFGVVGTGAMAGTMLECLKASRRVATTAVASSDPARAREFARRFGVPHACDSLDDLLARTDVDAVYIASATRDHAAHGMAALAAGKAVLCEKPFATTAAQGLLVAEAARRHGRLYMEGQWTTALPAYRALLRLAQERTLGDPVLLRSEFGLALAPASHGRLFEGEGAGVLLDFGVYPLVLALQLLGPVRGVHASVAHNGAGVDVHAALLLEHANGGQSQLAMSLVASLPNVTTLACTRGDVRLDSPVMGAESLRQRAGAPIVATPQGGEGAVRRLAASLRRYRALRKLRSLLPAGDRIELPFGSNRYGPQLDHFVSLLDSGALESPWMPLATSLDVLRIVDAARSAPYTVIAP